MLHLHNEGQLKYHKNAPINTANTGLYSIKPASKLYLCRVRQAHESIGQNWRLQAVGQGKQPRICSRLI